MHNHLRLEIWIRSSELSVQICAAISRMRGRRYRAVLGQLERAIVSVPSNIAEGAGQSSDAQFARFLSIAIGSINESMSHLELLSRLSVLPAAQAREWCAELIAIRRMTHGLRQRLIGPAPSPDPPDRRP
ncbi:MAG: four helix bundle protein [Gemmatimonadaceae bacterium]|jgi:four helix bundle protein|nr:four helix bundle protein [Gemmatimonadaceae bacterium]MCC6429427.1 four helix bundle protein [Gemmatimonadaceae bacterium]